MYGNVNVRHSTYYKLESVAQPPTYKENKIYIWLMVWYDMIYVKIYYVDVDVDVDVCMYVV